MKTLIKIDRLSAWGLFVSMLLYFVTGYGMTKGIISASFATKLHLSWLTYFVLLFFVIHTSYAIHLAFKRWQIWNGLAKFGLITFYLIFIGAFFYVDLAFQKPVIKTSSVQPESSIDNTDSSTSTSTISSSQSSTTNTSELNSKTFTLAELAKYNGQNGQPAYVAVEGQIYDMTTVFANGSHYSHLAGTELTDAFYTRHAKSSITKYPVVGALK